MFKFHVYIVCLFLLTCSLPAPAQDANAGHEIIGAPNCKTCHKDLAEKGKPTGPFKKCNECHEKKKK